MTPEQRQKIYDLQSKYAEQIEALNGQLEALQRQRDSAADQWTRMKEVQQIKLDAILRSAMADSPELRMRGAESLADELREWLGLSPSRSAGSPTGPAELADAAKPVPWWKRWLWLGAAAGLGLMAVAAHVSERPAPTAATQAQPRG